MYIPFLSRKQSRMVALFLVGMGILLMPDFIAPTPMMDLFLNVPLAMLISDLYSMTYLNAFMMTYMIAFALVASGLLVYPYNTKRLLIGRIKASATYIIRNPMMLIIAIVCVLIVYMIGQYAYDTVYAYAKEIIMGVI